MAVSADRFGLNKALRLRMEKALEEARKEVPRLEPWFPWTPVAFDPKFFEAQSSRFDNPRNTNG